MAVLAGGGRRGSCVYRAEAGALPSSVDVVIVGGGVIGCSTLYHLAKSGVTNVLLLERDQLTSGTTWHTAGRGEGGSLH